MSTDAQGPLSGLTILVVEDDYYQATDTGETFELAGATVVGPFGGVGDAISAIERNLPDCAVIDVNLGRGPEFELARELKARGIPTVFVSGYHATIMPDDLREFTHLEKPVEHAMLVRTVHGLVLPIRQR